MKRLRTLISEHRAAAAIVAVALVAFAVWKVYVVATTSAVRPGPPSREGQAGTVGAPGGEPAGDAALRAAGHLAGTTPPALPGGQPSTGAAPGGSAASAAAQAPSNPPSGTGRSDPFSPLAVPGGGGPASSNPPLPPVPPLSPGAVGPSGFTAPGSPPAGGPDVPGPRGQFHLMGIVYGPVALAILNDGAASYIVEPGDTVTPGVRIVAIDAGNRSVTLASKDQSWQLRLGGGTSR